MNFPTVSSLLLALGWRSALAFVVEGVPIQSNSHVWFKKKAHVILAF